MSSICLLEVFKRVLQQRSEGNAPRGAFQTQVFIA